MSAKIKQGDTVIVIAGKWKGLKGEVLDVRRGQNGKSSRVVVEGIVATVHVKPDPRVDRKGGIEKRPSAIDISNVALYDGSSKIKVGIERVDGKNRRINKVTKAVLDLPSASGKEK